MCVFNGIAELTQPQAKIVDKHDRINGKQCIQVKKVWRVVRFGYSEVEIQRTQTMWSAAVDLLW